jgi:hypothetical protein
VKLDDKGRCPNCLIKPLVYKTEHGTRHPAGHFCHRCCRSYRLDGGEQQENWAWTWAADRFCPVSNNADYANATPSEKTKRAAARLDAVTSGE